jgi:hypothetical protein
MAGPALDHVTLGAAALDQGADLLRRTLGLETQPGGKHPDMGTHNRLARVGDTAFLEVLAIDPEAPRPFRPRWFGMDSPACRARLAHGPAPIGWVVRTDDIEAAAAASPVPLGPIVPLSRGGRSWRLTVPDDGSVPGDGLLPGLIQWSPGPLPATALPRPAGPLLERVVLRHPEPGWLRDALAALGVAGLAEVLSGSPALAFRFRMPDGTARLLG